MLLPWKGTRARSPLPLRLLLSALTLSPVLVACSSGSPTAEPNGASACLDNPSSRWVTRQFALEGRCADPDDGTLCAYHDYREVPRRRLTGFDQRGVQSEQVTFPGLEHLWAALSIKRKHGTEFCWVGGAIAGRNPLSMNWGGPSGTKRRKNNFLLSEGGRIEVHGARIHNIHDALLADGPTAGFEVRDSWITWNRDDFFEGYLQDLSIRDTLVDGTYTFISDPDGECEPAKVASDRTIVIEDSLIRLQRQPGPYGGGSPQWHWQVEGGHDQLWKLDSCGWADWPKFVLRNNVFLIEGPGTSAVDPNLAHCNLALPGACGDELLSNLAVCENNLFLYAGYSHWRDAGTAPGPTPVPGGRFFNPDNPDYERNGRDCYQRLTDDAQRAKPADVFAIWHDLRARWIRRHTTGSGSTPHVMRIPGVDIPVIEDGSLVRLKSVASGECLTSQDDGSVGLRRCVDGESGQRFRTESFDDGKLLAAMLLMDQKGRYLRSQPPPVLERARQPSAYDPQVYAEAPAGNRPGFAERWYVLPLDEAATGRGSRYAIESDALRRTWLRAGNGEVELQRLYAQGPETALPQPRFSGGGDTRLHWNIEIVELRTVIQ